MQEIRGQKSGTDRKTRFYKSDVEKISSRFTTSTSSSPSSSSFWPSLFCTSKSKVVRSKSIHKIYFADSKTAHQVPSCGGSSPSKL